ncbi:MAG: 7TM diverse intracellular signaling domain-containing protein [Cytophagaceae bacterium]
MNRGRIILLVVLSLGSLVGFPLSAFPQSGIVLNDSSELYRIEPATYVFEDKKGNLRFADILAQDSLFFVNTLQSSSLEPSSNSVWYKFRIKNHAKNSQWYLQIGNPSIQQVNFYSPGISGSYTHVQLGSKHSLKNQVSTNQIILPIYIPPDSSRIFYLQARSQEVLYFPLFIASMKKLYESNHNWDMLNGLNLGLLIALMVFNLFVFISVRDRTYLYYIFYTLFIILQLTCFGGYGLEYLWAEVPWMNNSDVYCGLSIIFSVLFTRSFLQTRHYIPKLRWPQLLLIGCLIVAVVFQVGQFKLIMSFPFMIYVFVIGIAVYRKGFKPAKYYLLGFGSLIAGIMIFLMEHYGILPLNDFTANGIQVGFAVEALVLSYALADKLNFYKKEKEKAQAHAILQATDFSKQLIQSQERERKRVASELHDSIGQSLILIKNKVHTLKAHDDRTKQGGYLNDLTEMVSDTIAEVRSISYGLRPFQLDLLGLTRSIHSLVEEVAESGQIQFKIETDNIDDVFSKNAHINIYRIIQECLNNIVKHSGATEGRVIIRKKESAVEITIEDYGKGFSAALFGKNSAHGFGLIGMQERLNILSGKIFIKKAEPHGTSVSIILPVSGNKPESARLVAESK